MSKVRLFVYRDMTVIDLGEDTFANFLSYDRETVVANVTAIEHGKSGSVTVYTDYVNPCRSQRSRFLLSAENFAKVRWVTE